MQTSTRWYDSSVQITHNIYDSRVSPHRRVVAVWAYYMSVNCNPLTPLLRFVVDCCTTCFYSWQDTDWHSASRGPSAVAELCFFKPSNIFRSIVCTCSSGTTIYFASPAVAVDSSVTASSSASWSRFSPPSNFVNGYVVYGLSLATITGRRLGETPFVQVSTTWALTCPETVHQRPCMTREIETWLSYSRVGTTDSWTL